MYPSIISLLKVFEASLNRSFCQQSLHLAFVNAMSIDVTHEETAAHRLNFDPQSFDIYGKSFSININRVFKTDMTWYNMNVHTCNPQNNTLTKLLGGLMQ